MPTPMHFHDKDIVVAYRYDGSLKSVTPDGATVVFSSHVMELVDRICDRVGILHEGRLVAAGRIEQVRGEGTLEEAFLQLVGAAAAPKESLEWLATSSD